MDRLFERLSTQIRRCPACTVFVRLYPRADSYYLPPFFKYWWYDWDRLKYALSFNSFWALLPKYPAKLIDKSSWVSFSATLVAICNRHIPCKLMLEGRAAPSAQFPRLYANPRANKELRRRRPCSTCPLPSTASNVARRKQSAREPYRKQFQPAHYSRTDSHLFTYRHTALSVFVRIIQRVPRYFPHQYC